MPWPSSPTMNRYRLFMVDALGSAFTAFVLSAAVWGGFDAMGQAGLFIVMFAPVLLAVAMGLIFVPFVVGPIYGLAKGRYGLVLGPVILALGAYVYSAWTPRQNEDAIAALTASVTEPIRTNHTLLAIEGGRSAALCDEVCVKVLATSTYAVAHPMNRRWVVYRRATGAATCLAKENAKLALDFLRRGYPGKCATQESIVNFDDGLFLRKRTPDPRYWPAPDLPKGFTGTVYESFERTAAQDRLLERRMIGTMAPLSKALLLFEKRPQPFDAGPRIDEDSFLANAIKSDVDALRKPADPFPFDETLTAIENYFGRKEVVGGGATVTIEDFAMRAWREVAVLETQQKPELLKRLLLGLFASRDPFRIKLGLSLIYEIRPVDERTFPGADDLILDLMFTPLSETAASQVQTLLERQFAPGRSPPSNDVRERAKAYLSAPNLKPWQRQVLTRISNF